MIIYGKTDGQKFLTEYATEQHDGLEAYTLDDRYKASLPDFYTKMWINEQGFVQVPDNLPVDQLTKLKQDISTNLSNAEKELNDKVTAVQTETSNAAAAIDTKVAQANETLVKLGKAFAAAQLSAIKPVATSNVTASATSAAPVSASSNTSSNASANSANTQA